MDGAITAAEILARPKAGGFWCWTGTHWSDHEITALRVLCEAGADVEKSADALGRSPTSIAHRAKDTGLPIPSAWAGLIRTRKAPRPLIVATPALAYPFIVRRRDEHADLMAVNGLVPRGLPGREDVCQEIMLALWEGKITLDQLKANRSNVRAFVRTFTTENYEGGGYAMSLDQPMHDGRSWHDILPAPRNTR